MESQNVSNVQLKTAVLTAMIISAKPVKRDMLYLITNVSNVALRFLDVKSVTTLITVKNVMTMGIYFSVASVIVILLKGIIGLNQLMTANVKEILMQLNHLKKYLVKIVLNAVKSLAVALNAKLRAIQSLGQYLSLKVGHKVLKLDI